MRSWCTTHILLFLFLFLKGFQPSCAYNALIQFDFKFNEPKTAWRESANADDRRAVESMEVMQDIENVFHDFNDWYTFGKTGTGIYLQDFAFYLRYIILNPFCALKKDLKSLRSVLEWIPGFSQSLNRLSQIKKNYKLPARIMKLVSPVSEKFKSGWEGACTISISWGGRLVQIIELLDKLAILAVLFRTFLWISNQLIWTALHVKLDIIPAIEAVIDASSAESARYLQGIGGYNQSLPTEIDIKSISQNVLEVVPEHMHKPFRRLLQVHNFKIPVPTVATEPNIRRRRVEPSGRRIEECEDDCLPDELRALNNTAADFFSLIYGVDDYVGEKILPLVRAAQTFVQGLKTVFSTFPAETFLFLAEFVERLWEAIQDAFCSGSAGFVCDMAAIFSSLEDAIFDSFGDRFVESLQSLLEDYIPALNFEFLDVDPFVELDVTGIDDLMDGLDFDFDFDYIDDLGDKFWEPFKNLDIFESLDGINLGGFLDFRVARSTSKQLSFSCPAGKFPYVLEATIRTMACMEEPDDVTVKMLQPCSDQNSCDYTYASPLSENCDADFSPNYRQYRSLVDSLDSYGWFDVEDFTAFLAYYTCLTPEQLENASPLPSRIEVTDGVVLCSPDQIIKVDDIVYQEDGSTKCARNSIPSEYQNYCGGRSLNWKEYYTQQGNGFSTCKNRNRRSSLDRPLSVPSDHPRHGQLVYEVFVDVKRARDEVALASDLSGVFLSRYMHGTSGAAKRSIKDDYECLCGDPNNKLPVTISGDTCDGTPSTDCFSNDFFEDWQYVDWHYVDWQEEKRGGYIRDTQVCERPPWRGDSTAWPSVYKYGNTDKMNDWIDYHYALYNATGCVQEVMGYCDGNSWICDQRSICNRNPISYACLVDGIDTTPDGISNLYTEISFLQGTAALARTSLSCSSIAGGFVHVLTIEVGTGFIKTSYDSYDGCEGLAQCFVGVTDVDPDVDPAADYALRVEYECVCGAGYYPALNVTTNTCDPVQAGKYRSESMTDPAPCPEGTFSVEGSIDCTDCSPGTFAADFGNPECTPCEAGEYQDEFGQTSCKPARIEKYVDEMGAIIDEWCPQGTEANEEGNINCTLVDPGYYSNSPDSNTRRMLEPMTESTGALPCPPGMYNVGEGNDECYACPKGHYALYSASSFCQVCPFNTYQDEEGKTQCKLCGEGYYTEQVASSSSSECLEIPEPIDYFDSIYSNYSCRELLSLDLEEHNDTIVESRLSQVGNGLCNRGPHNTPQCEWDGGDCCPQSCVLPVSDEESDVPIYPWSCQPFTFFCLDPAVSGSGFDTCDTANGTSTPISYDFYNLTFGLEDDDVERIGDPEYDVGNGYCEENLNTEEYEFDGGDCCWQTCVPKDGTFGTCTGPWLQEKCKNPDVQNSTGTVLDTERPQIISAFGGQAFDDIHVSADSVPSSFGVVASDNDPCFEGGVIFDESRTDGRCPNEYVLERSWFAEDPTGNNWTETMLVYVNDTTPPTYSKVGPFCLENTRRKKFWYQFDLSAERYGLSNATDVCGDMPSDYCDWSVEISIDECNVNENTEDIICRIDNSTNKIVSIFVEKEKKSPKKKSSREESSPEHRIYSFALSFTDSCGNTFRETIDFVIADWFPILEETNCTEIISVLPPEKAKKGSTKKSANKKKSGAKG